MNNKTEVFPEDRTLTFGYTLVSKSPKESDTFHSAFYNPVLKAFGCFDDTSIHMWDPHTGKTVYSANSSLISKGYKIVCLTFSAAHEVLLNNSYKRFLDLFRINGRFQAARVRP